ncbi:protein yellow-like [Anoplophora glabripennis]|uniref:protein yellow-like n=1 Tax=Anoplophora glabripennis TaxID=217634 RepID=UPI000874AB9A|nr:protein yellow-like [Anoplophora glabripennis]XP_018563314.1 protein yellow-like [Anoplophora glabripennis]
MKKQLGLLTFYSYFLNALSLEIVNQWNFLNFDFPGGVKPHDFKPENTIFTGLEITDDRIFLAIPSLRAGVPASLVTLPKNTPPGSSPALQAYPDWSYHRAGNANLTCDGLISVYRIRTDSCNRLWVLDAGVMTSIDSFTTVCPPKLVAFDLKTNQPVRVSVLPKEVIRPFTALTNLVIDESVQGKCDSAFFYITDTTTPGLIVYDGKKDQAWRFSHPTMYPNPDSAVYDIAGDRFSFMDGIIGLAHSPQLATLFFQPLATERIFSVPTAALTKGPPAELEELPVSLAGRKSSQGLGLAMNHEDNTLFFGPFTETSIASWNVVTNDQNVLAYDPINLQFTAELRWKQDGSLWILSSRFHRFFKRTVTPNEINLRIMRIKLARPALPQTYTNFYF